MKCQIFCFLLIAAFNVIADDEILFTLNVEDVNKLAMDAAYQANTNIPRGDLKPSNGIVSVICHPKNYLDSKEDEFKRCSVSIDFIIQSTVEESLTQEQDYCQSRKKYEQISVYVYSDGSTEVSEPTTRSSIGTSNSIHSTYCPMKW